jgi:hypothetical protein
MNLANGKEKMTKTQRKELARALIDKQAVDVLFSTDDLAVLNKLVGWEVTAAKRIFNALHPKDTRCVAISKDGITFEAWSWVKAIDGYNFSKNVTYALRQAIQKQMKAYALGSSKYCVKCGATDFLSVDHKTKAFTKIAAEFRVKSPQLDYYITNDLDGSGWKLKSSAVELLWQQYHEQHADYQILCRSCNSRKGAKHGADS